MVSEVGLGYGAQCRVKMAQWMREQCGVLTPFHLFAELRRAFACRASLVALSREI